MHLTWLGAAAFKIEFKTAADDGVLLIDPYTLPKETMPRTLGADLVLASRGSDELISLTKEPFFINEAGEYECKQVLVYGFQTTHTQNAPLIFRTEIEHMTVAHLGSLVAPLSEALMNELNGVDVLLVPVGGASVLSPERAAQLVTAVEPRVVIPYCFSANGTGAGWGVVGPFLKAIGATASEPQTKIKLAKKDLPNDQLVCIVPEKQ